MNESIWLVQLAHFFLSSLLVFTITAGLMEFGLWFFRVKNSRLKSICRLLPILKLPLDLLLYKFSAWNIFMNFNPFSCQFYIEKMLVELMPSAWTEGVATRTSSPLASFIAHYIPSGILQLVVGGVAAISIGLLLKKLFQCLLVLKELRNMRMKAVPSKKSIENPLLRQELVKNKVQILVSDVASMPMATGSHFIIVPSTLEQMLSQEEFESVIGHELAHLRWKDPLFKILSLVITSTFWWIPTKWWVSRLHNDQEEASDAEISANYGLDKWALASAIIKIIKRPYETEEVVCHLASPKSSLVKRFQTLLSERPLTDNISSGLGALVSALALIAFWIC